MIRRFFLFVVLISIFSSYSAHSQGSAPWIKQSNGFFTLSRSVSYFQAVTPDVAWAVLSDPDSLFFPSRDFTHTADGGTNWIPCTVHGYDSLKAGMVHAYTDQIAWITLTSSQNKGGKILKTTDGGQTWSSQDSAVFHNNPRIIHFWGGDTGVAIGDPYMGSFEIYITTNGGSDWNLLPASDLPYALDTWKATPSSAFYRGNNMWFAGHTDGEIFTSPDRGRTWSFLPSPLPSIEKVIIRDTMGLIGYPDLVSDQWNLYLTPDRGATWTPIQYSGYIHQNDLGYVPGTTGSFISVGLGISQSNDFGQTWYEVSTFAGSPYWYTTVNFINPLTGWVGSINPDGVVGGIYKYNGPAISVNNLDSKNLQVNIFPNPAHDFVSVSIPGLDGKNFRMVMINMTGQEVINKEISNSSDHVTFDISDLKPGVYGLMIGNEKQQIFSKLVIN